MELEGNRPAEMEWDQGARSRAGKFAQDRAGTVREGYLAEGPLVPGVAGHELQQVLVLLLGEGQRCQIRGWLLCDGCHVSWGRCCPRPAGACLVLRPGELVLGIASSSWVLGAGTRPGEGVVASWAAHPRPGRGEHVLGGSSSSWGREKRPLVRVKV